MEFIFVDGGSGDGGEDDGGGDCGGAYILICMFVKEKEGGWFEGAFFLGGNATDLPFHFRTRMCWKQ